MNKIALITGASKGIGKALAEVFARNGFSLILTARSTDELGKLQADLKSRYGCEAKTVSLDLARADSVDALMDACKEEMDRVEVLVNNAGFGAAKKFTDMTADELNGMLAVNIAALTRLTWRVLPYMTAKKRGRILNVASTAAFGPGPYMAEYYASKAYVLSLSEALYEEYRKDGVTVSTLCPGLTKTEFHQRAGTDKAMITSGLIPAMTAEKVAEIGYQGLMKNRRVIVAGIINRLTHVLMCLTPNFLLIKATALMDRPKNP